MTEDFLINPCEGLKWPDDRERAGEIQAAVSRGVRLSSLVKTPAYIAGADAAFCVMVKKAVGAVCLFKFPEMTKVEENHVIKDLTFPYIPGLLSFREGAAIISAILGLRIKPDLIILDGQGIAHPKGAGIASYAGVTLDTPAIGCAKSRLIGQYDEPDGKRGSFSLLKQGKKTIGAVLRTRDNVRPVFVSPGHKVSLRDAIRITLATTAGYRLTEPVRCADILSKRVARGLTGG